MKYFRGVFGNVSSYCENNEGIQQWRTFVLSVPNIISEVDMPCEIRGSHVGVANCMIFED
jgi:hypothetical protein